MEDVAKTAHTYLYIRHHPSGEPPRANEDIHIKILWRQCYEDSEMSEANFTHPIIIV
jgi:hypothetical protein